MEDEKLQEGLGNQSWLLLLVGVSLLTSPWFWQGPIWLAFDISHWIRPVGDGKIPQGTETVMSPGMTLSVQSPDGSMMVLAGSGLKRSYVWEGATRSVEMWPRHDRWFGKRGMYYPGPGNHWFPHNGVTRACVEEAQINFSSEQAAVRWLAHGPLAARIYTSDGLAIEYRRSPPTITMDVFQVYVNGRRPLHLPGAHDELIEVSEDAKIPDATTAPLDAVPMAEEQERLRYVH